MSEADGTVIGAIIGSIGTIIAVLIGARLLKGRVKDVESALETMKASIDTETVEMRSKFDELSTAMNSAIDKINILTATVDDDTNATVVAEPEAAEVVDFRSELKRQWVRVRDKIESAASDPKIDGRTRAAYARRDRRQYWQIIGEVAADGNLPGDLAAYEEALQIWMAHKSGRTSIPNADVERIRGLADRVSAF